MKEENKKPLKAGIWYTISNFLVKGIGFILTPIFARLISKNDMGLYNNFYSWITILGCIITLNLDSTLISAKRDYRDKMEPYVFSINILSSVSILLFCAIFNIYYDFFSKFLMLDRFFINCIFIYLFFSAIINHFQSKQRFLYEYKSSVMISVILVLSNAILSIIFVLILDNDYLARVLGTIIPTMIIGLILYAITFAKKNKLNFEIWKYALPIALPMIPHLLSIHMLSSIDKIMITNICGSEYTAMYSVAYSCGTIISILVNSMNNAFAPWLGDKLVSKSYKAIKKVSNIYFIAFCFFAIGAQLIAPEILMIMGGKKYMDALYIIPPVALSCVCQFAYCMYVNIEQLQRKTKWMALASVICALVNAILNFIFIPVFGYVVAAYTTLFGYFLLLVMHTFIVYKIGYGKIYQAKVIYTLLFILALVTLLINCTYSMYFVRYICILLYCLVFLCLVLKNKNIFLSLIKHKH